MLYQRPCNPRPFEVRDLRASREGVRLRCRIKRAGHNTAFTSSFAQNSIESFVVCNLYDNRLNYILDFEQKIRGNGSEGRRFYHYY